MVEKLDGLFSQMTNALDAELMDAAEKREARRQKIAAQQTFHDQWISVYNLTGNDSDFDLIADRLLALKAEILSHFWDFRIAVWLEGPDYIVEFQLAMLLLYHACTGERPTIVSLLRSAASHLADIGSHHVEFIGQFQAEDSRNFPPFTPPLSQVELANAIGMSYDKLRGQVKARDWDCIDVPLPPGEHRPQQRRWRHKDANIQTAALDGIRQKFPEKIWSRSATIREKLAKQKQKMAKKQIKNNKNGQK